MGDRRRPRAVCGGLAPLALLLAAAPARAAPEPEIPSQCGSRAAFDSELVRRLGQDAPIDSVRISISKRNNRFHLRVQVAGERRELDDASCPELFRAAVVVAVAMLLHDQPPQSAAREPAPSKTLSRDSARFALGLGAGLNVGTVGQPVLSVELESKLLLRYGGLGLSLRYLAPAETLDAQNKGVLAQAFGASVTGIFRPSRPWEARLGFAAQRLLGRGLGTTPQDGAAWAAGPTLGLGWVPLERGRFWAGLGAEGQLNVLQGRFEIRHYSGKLESREVFTVPWLAGSAFVRLGLIW